MRATINFDDNRGHRQSTQVRPGQRLVIGSSFSADIVLGNTMGVVSEHVELHLKKDGCAIRNLTGNADTVLVNGEATSSAILSDGDSVEIGSNRLDFTCEDSTTSESGTSATGSFAAPAAAVASTQLASKNVEEPQTEEFSGEPRLERHGKISILTIESFVESVYPVMEKIAEEKEQSEPDAEAPSPRCYLVCNHKRARSGDKPKTVNFLEGAPAEIAEQNDLYLQPVLNKSALEKSVDAFLRKDAGLIGIVGPDKQETSVAQQFPLLAAWFMIPSTLKFNLINGSPLLLEKVFGLFDFLVISDPNENADLVVINDPAIVCFETFLERIKGVNG